MIDLTGDRICGAYKISIGDFFYYGSAVDCEDRWLSHLADLRFNKHSNCLMQKAYNNLRKFRTEVVKVCDDRQQAYVEEQNLLNENYESENCLNVQYHTQEAENCIYSEKKLEIMRVRSEFNRDERKTRHLVEMEMRERRLSKSKKKKSEWTETRPASPALQRAWESRKSK